MGIWDYKEIRKTINNQSNLVTLNEGNTPEITLVDQNNQLVLKREDKNPTGSWKDRGTAYKLTSLISNGIKQAVIASSGNAAISLMKYANTIGDFKLHVVISESTSLEKKEIIHSLVNNIHQIYLTDNVRVKAVEISAMLQIPNLKVSIDDEVLTGYWSLGFELSHHFKKQDNKNSAIFLPVSSGSTMVGIVQGLHSHLQSEFDLPKIFAVQTQRVHPIVDLLYPENVTQSSNTSLADAIIDKTALRSPQLLKIIKETQGDALLISDEEILTAIEFLKVRNIDDVSYTSALSVAGYLKVKNSYNFVKTICILSGR